MSAEAPPRADESAAASHDRTWRALGLVAVAAGIVLRLIQFLACPSIWVDEAALVRSILDRGPLALLVRPLDFGQVAPPAFLLVVKLCSVLFGAGEASLRLLPLAAGILSLPLFAQLARCWSSAAGAAVATVLFALAMPLIAFSANVKPYAVDVLVVVAILLLSARAVQQPSGRRRDRVLAGAGVLACLFSNPAMFVLPPAALLLVGSSWRGAGDERRRRLAIATTWGMAVVASIAWNVWLESPTDRQYLALFWGGGFAPRDLDRFGPWLLDVLVHLVGDGDGPFSGALEYRSPTILVALTAIGGVRAAWRGWTARLLLLGPVALALVASANGMFPFAGRIVMFLVPVLLLLMVHGAEAAGRLVLRGARGDLAALLLLPVAVRALLDNPLPQRPEEIRPVMEYVRTHRRPDDAVWVYYGAGQAFAYYADRIPLRATAVSECDRANPAGQLEQVDVLRGRPRAWVVVAHAYRLGATNERVPLLRYLDRIGERLDTFPPDFPEDAPRGDAAAFLYRLDDPARLASASAATFPVPDTRGNAWSCYATMSPDPRGGARATAAILATMPER